MARTTISVPNDLYEKMRQSEGFNWSAIAAEAFRDAIEEKEGGAPTADDFESAVESIIESLVEPIIKRKLAKIFRK